MLSKPAKADFDSDLKLWRVGQAEPRAALTSPLQLAPYPDVGSKVRREELVSGAKPAPQTLL